MAFTSILNNVPENCADDFTARVCKEGIFDATGGKFCRHDKTFPNALRLIDLTSQGTEIWLSEVLPF